MPTTIVRYVNTNSPAGGNGTTPSITAGDANRAYRSLSASLAAEYINYPNLVTADAILKIECAGGADTASGDGFIVPGFSGSLSQYVWVYCAPENGHRGTWNPNGYIIKNSANNAQVIRLENIRNIRIEGLQIENASTNGVWSVLANAGASLADNYPEIIRCFIRSISASGNPGNAISLGSGTSRRGLRAYNNIIQGRFNPAIKMDFIAARSTSSLLYNNTLIGAVTGINYSGNSGRVLLYNNIVSGGYCYVNTGTTASAANISSDDTSPDVAFRNLVPSFVSTVTSSANFNLLDTDTAAKGRGINLATDPSYSFAFDAASNRRPTKFGKWDIGALQNQNIQNTMNITQTGGKQVIIGSVGLGNSIQGSI